MMAGFVCPLDEQIGSGDLGSNELALIARVLMLVAILCMFIEIWRMEKRIKKLEEKREGGE